MDSSAPSSGYLVDNLDYLMGMSADIYAMTLYSKDTTRRGDKAHAPVHDGIRALLLNTTEAEITTHIGDVTHAASRLGDDVFIVSWKTGSSIAKSRVRAVKRAVKRKVPPAKAPGEQGAQEIAA